MADVLSLEQTSGRRRRVELLDADLPEEGVESGAELRRTTSWAPGAERPVVQVLGRQHAVMTFQGQWTTQGTRYESILALIRTVEAILAEAGPVRLLWGDRWQRVGLVVRFTPRWLDADRCDWTLEYEPHATEQLSNAALRQRARVPRVDVTAAAVALAAVGTAQFTALRVAAAATWIAGIDP